MKTLKSGRKLSPEALGLLAKRLAKTSDPTEATKLNEPLARGFYAAK